MAITSRQTGFAVVGGLLLATFATYAASARPSAGAHPPRARPAHGAAQAFALPAPDAAGEALDALAAAVLPAAADKDGVKLAVRADRGAVLAGSDGELHVEVAFSADTPAAGAAARQPSDVLVVLDISGSMAGQKLDYAKQALHQLVQRLDARDRFGLVAYESEAELLAPLAPVTREARARLAGLIDALETRGGTNMSAGLDLGLAELRRERERDRSARVLLLSDGHANTGDSSPEGLQARVRSVTRAEHVLSALGIGDDFNEDLMTSLAEVGTGNFYYLSKVAVLGDFFDAELRANQQTVARALELRFDGEDNVEMLDASGYPIERDGKSARVRPGNLYAGQKRTLWVTLRVPTSQLGERKLGRFSLAFKRADAPADVQAPPLPAVACVSDRQRFEHAIDKDLWQRFVLEDQRHKTELEIGAAVGNGTEQDIQRAYRLYAQNSALAARLGATDVTQSIAEMSAHSAASVRAQSAPSADRSYNAKQQKARALYQRRPDNYLLLNPYSGL